MMEKLLCKLGLHKWIYGESVRVCDRCGRLEKFVCYYTDGEPYYEVF